MAKATTIPPKTETVVKVVEPKKVVLELDENEATVLRIILANIGGTSEDSPRKYVDSMITSLDKVFTPKVDIYAISRLLGHEMKSHHFGKKINHSIYFNEVGLDFSKREENLDELLYCCN